MSSAPPTALATIAASTFMTLLPFPSTSRTPTPRIAAHG
jgi:hypothetical protein